MKRLPLPFLIASVISIQALPSINYVWQELLGTKNAYAKEAAAVKYTCPMHPQIMSDSPGQCPICGMDLVPLEGGHEHGADNQTQAITFTVEQVQKMNVRTVKVEHMKLPRDAIMQTPDGSHVIIALGEGKFTEQSVTIDSYSGDMAIVDSGIEDGQEIVVSGQFLIDAEFILRKNNSGDNNAQ